MKKITLTIILFFAIITLSNAQFSLSQEEDHKFLREAIREYDMAHFMKSNTLLESYFEKRKKASDWSRHYTLDVFEGEIKKVLK